MIFTNKPPFFYCIEFFLQKNLIFIVKMKTYIFFIINYCPNKYFAKFLITYMYQLGKFKFSHFIMISTFVL